MIREGAAFGRILKAWVGWAERGKPHQGICTRIKGRDYERALDLMAEWPEFSGLREFPIPGKYVAPGVNSHEAYNMVRLNPHRWLQYERARCRLAAFLVEKCYERLREE